LRDSLLTQLLIAVLAGSCCLATGHDSAFAQSAEIDVSATSALLESAEVRERWLAAYRLGQAGPDAAAAVESLTAVLANRGGHEYVRGMTAWALGRIGSAARSAAPTLIEALRSGHVSVRRNAPRALARLQIDSPDALAGLRKMLDDSDGVARVEAAAALWQLAEDQQALQTLTDALHGRGTGAHRAAELLGEIDVEPTRITPALTKTLGHPDASMRRAAARALGNIGPATLAALREPLDNGTAEARRAAVEAMGWMGAAAERALVYALSSDAPAARRAAARALGRLGSSAESAQSALVEAVNDPDPSVRTAAAAALRQLRQGN